MRRCGEGGDRVAAAPLLDLLLVAVLLGVGHRVAAVAVGDRLDELRLAVLAGLLQRVGDDRVDVEHVHAVAAMAGDAEALGLLREVGHGGVTLQRGAHAELVVDDHEDDRQLPERDEVHRLAERALVGGAVAHHREDHVLRAEVVGRERDAAGEREAAADDAVAAEEAALGVEEVHRAAAAAGAAVDAAEQLGHHGVRVGAARERLAVLAVGRHQVVGLAQRLGAADDGGLLADAEVEEAADFGFRVHLAGALLEAADEHHLREDEPARVLVRQVVLAGLMPVFLRRSCADGVLRCHGLGPYPLAEGLKTPEAQFVQARRLYPGVGLGVAIVGPEPSGWRCVKRPGGLRAAGLSRGRRPRPRGGRRPRRAGRRRRPSGRRERRGRRRPGWPA